jgi:hypothetical protein
MTWAWILQANPKLYDIETALLERWSSTGASDLRTALAG